MLFTLIGNMWCGLVLCFTIIQEAYADQMIYTLMLCFHRLIYVNFCNFSLHFFLFALRLVASLSCFSSVHVFGFLSIGVNVAPFFDFVIKKMEINLWFPIFGNHHL